MSDQWVPPDQPADTAPPPQPAPPPPPTAGSGWGAIAPPLSAWEALKPGIVALRPLTLAEILDGAIAVIRRQPRLTLGLAAGVACVQRIIGLAVAAATGGIRSPGDTSPGLSSAVDASSLGGAIATFLVNEVLAVLLTGLLTLVVAEAVLGRDIAASELWRRVRPLAVRLIVASLLASAAAFVGLAFCVVPGLFLWGALALTTPALVLERTTIGGALRRSWRLAVPDWWRVWGIRALGFIIATVVASVIAVPFAIVAVATSGGGGLDIGGLALLSVGAIAGSIITEPFLAGVVTLLYIDRRMRAEALDIALARTVSPSST